MDTNIITRRNVDPRGWRIVFTEKQRNYELTMRQLNCLKALSEKKDNVYYLLRVKLDHIKKRLKLHAFYIITYTVQKQLKYLRISIHNHLFSCLGHISSLL